MLAFSCVLMLKIAKLVTGGLTAVSLIYPTWFVGSLTICTDGITKLSFGEEQATALTLIKGIVDKIEIELPRIYFVLLDKCLLFFIIYWALIFKKLN